MMRIFILAKTKQVTSWADDAALGFQAAGHEVARGSTRNPFLSKAVEALLFDPRLGAPRAAAIVRRIRDFRPDLILAFAAYGVPVTVLQAIAALPVRPPLVGWVGDQFNSEAIEAARLFDLIAYTDSGMLAQHRALGLTTPAVFLPHAAPPARVTAATMRRRLMTFVANPTPFRRSVLHSIHTPIDLFGPGWRGDAELAHHNIAARRVGPLEIAGIYAGHLASLNIRNEQNLPNGLNQRHFHPYMFGMPVLTDFQADLERCFDPGQEVLIWRDTDELNETYDRMSADPNYASIVGARGQKRVQSEHLYAHRLRSLTSVLQLPQRYSLSVE